MAEKRAIRVNLEIKVSQKFDMIKEKYSFTSDSDAIRFCISVVEDLINKGIDIPLPAKPASSICRERRGLITDHGQ